MAAETLIWLAPLAFATLICLAITVVLGNRTKWTGLSKDDIRHNNKIYQERKKRKLAASRHKKRLKQQASDKMNEKKQAVKTKKEQKEKKE